MLARLRHDAIVSGDHQQGKVDAGSACHHRVDEALVAGHVDETQNLAFGMGIGRGIGHLYIGKAQLDTDATRLFLF